MPLNIVPDTGQQGFLVPTNTNILSGQDLDNFFQQWVANIVDLPTELVRPRWQQDPPNEPEINTDWAAVGVISTDPLTNYAVVVHSGNDSGSDIVFHHEDIDCLVSFIGPNAHDFAKRFRLGLAIAQNREILILNQLGLTTTSNLLRIPDLLNEQWRDQFDIHVYCRRLDMANYNVRNISDTQIKITMGQVKTITSGMENVFESFTLNISPLGSTPLG
jgi:hypothetical protein